MRQLPKFKNRDLSTSAHAELSPTRPSPEDLAQFVTEEQLEAASKILPGWRFWSGYNTYARRHFKVISRTIDVTDNANLRDQLYDNFADEGLDWEFRTMFPKDSDLSGDLVQADDRLMLIIDWTTRTSDPITTGDILIVSQAEEHLRKNYLEPALA